MMTKRKFKTKWVLLICVIFIAMLMGLADYWISARAEDWLFSDVNKVPYQKVGLLLGTSKNLSNGLPNQYFQNRIKATAELYQAGKIDFIVVSGDNRRKDYNEPNDMKESLVAHNIPSEIIYLDYAGFRTLDSILRVRKVFGQKSFIVISQRFHNQRAIFIARHFKLNAFGYNAPDVSAYNGFKTKLREKFARVKLFIDLAVKKQPKFLGDPIEIE